VSTERATAERARRWRRHRRQRQLAHSDTTTTTTIDNATTSLADPTRGIRYRAYYQQHDRSNGFLVYIVAHGVCLVCVRSCEISSRYSRYDDTRPSRLSTHSTDAVEIGLIHAQFIKDASRAYVDIGRFVSGSGVRIDERQRDQYDRVTRKELERIGQRVAALKYLPLTNDAASLGVGAGSAITIDDGSNSSSNTAAPSFQYQPEDASLLLSDILAQAHEAAAATAATAPGGSGVTLSSSSGSNGVSTPMRTSPSTTTSTTTTANADLAPFLERLLQVAAVDDDDDDGATDATESNLHSSHDGDHDSKASTQQQQQQQLLQHCQGLVHVLYSRLQKLFEYHTEQHRLRLQQSQASREWILKPVRTADRSARAFASILPSLTGDSAEGSTDSLLPAVPSPRSSSAASSSPSPAATMGSSLRVRAATAEPRGAVLADAELTSELSQQQVQELRTENMELMQEFEGMLDQVRVVESQVAEISQLQDEFVGQVAQQAEAIDQIYHMTTQSTQRMRDGVQNLRDAATHSADSHVFILVLLITLSFALLFIHWYD